MTEETENMSKENETLNLVIPKDMARLISSAGYELDKTKSELVRNCILMALPIFLKLPRLIDTIRIEDYKLNDK